MKIVIGLGNPGKKYQANRHNVGHMFVDFLIKEGLEVKAMKTDCFMNFSGFFVRRVVDTNNLQLDEFLIAHDDLDIPFGKFKIEKGTGPKLHNGILSIEKSLQSKDFWRIRIGVDNREPIKRSDGEKYVLQDFSKQEYALLPQIFQQVVDKLRIIFHNE